MKLLLVDLDHPAGRVLSRFESIFAYRNGIFSAIDRLRRLHPDAVLVYLHPDARLEKLFADRSGLLPFRSDGSTIDLADSFAKPGLSITDRRSFIENELQALDFDAFEFPPDILSLLDEAPARIAADLFLLRREDFEHRAAAVITGAKQDLWIHHSVDLPEGVVFDTREGPIVIDRDCSLTPFTYIAGPFYAAPGCHLDNVRITGGTVLGDGCRVGGEIENSLFGRFSNKHHEGFVGHSLIGNWVNLGALTTTSDLKNNYGEIRLHLPEDRFPTRASSLIPIKTGKIKFGSIIGDCVKTAIGTMINTGTVIDAGSSIFGGTPFSYVPPLSWGLTGHSYRPGRFLEDCEKIFARRKQSVPSSMKELVSMLSHLS
jgi:glucose-1-phosphate thymidylyltransferase